MDRNLGNLGMLRLASWFCLLEVQLLTVTEVVTGVFALFLV